MQPPVDLLVEHPVQPCNHLGRAPPAALQVGRRERRVEVRQVRAARGLHELRHHFLELPGLATVVVQVRQVAREDGARDEVEHRRERRAADLHRGALAGDPADVVHELPHLVAPEVPERVRPACAARRDPWP